METDFLKTVLVLGMKAAGAVTDCVAELLPEETGQKVKSAGTALLKTVHEATGEILHEDACGKEPGPSGPKHIVIE